MPTPKPPVPPHRWPVAPAPTFAGWTPPAKPAAKPPAAPKPDRAKPAPRRP